MTLQEVAKQAGVSTATVSRVLNNASVVKEETRKRVLKAVAELKYHPNLHAQTLAGGKSTALGMIVSNIQNPFFLDIYYGLETVAHQAGYRVVLENTDYRASRLVASVRAMLGRRLAGMAVVVSEMEPSLVDELSSQDLPIVFYDVGHAEKNISRIKVRYDKGMERTVEYLYSLGHRRMAFVGHHASLNPLGERRRTFTRAMKGHAELEHLAVSSSDGPEGGRLATQQLFNSGFEPTAIICVNDFMAFGVIRELRDRGLKVPRDISVTGFDNIHLAEYATPALTTVNIPRQRIGQLIFETLVTPEDSAHARGVEILIDPELVVRESTGVPRSS